MNFAKYIVAHILVKLNKLCFLIMVCLENASIEARMAFFSNLIAQKWPKFQRSNYRCRFENQYISLKILS